MNGSGNVVQQVEREVKRGAEGRKNQGEVKRDERADSLVVEISAGRSHPKTSICSRIGEEKRSNKLSRRRRRSSAAATSGIKRLEIVLKKINKPGVNTVAADATG